MCVRLCQVKHDKVIASFASRKRKSIQPERVRMRVAEMHENCVVFKYMVKVSMEKN